MNQTQRKSLATETLAIIESERYNLPSGGVVDIRHDLAAAVAGSRWYRPTDFPDPIPAVSGNTAAAIEVTGETTLEAARRLAHASAVALNFASAKNPGGGFLNGSQAQEESLARSSGLYACQTANPELYEHNRNGGTCLYSDHMIYSPNVPVFRGDSGELLDAPYTVAFITAPAVNAGAVKRNEPQNIPLIVPTLRQRIGKLLWVARENGHRTVILGAWGCGVFRNDPTIIADLFAEALEPGGPCSGWFDHVVFAIYDSSENQAIVTPFRRRFKSATNRSSVSMV